jgi:hypothetical protein
MPIKLLSKQEINQKQALQRHNEIEEGRKLAKRVDNLREIAVQEEASLASFRAATLKSIDADIKKATKEHGEILTQVKELRSELETGFSELKKAERVVQLKENDLISREKQIEERVNLVKEKELQVKKDFEENITISSRLEYANNRLQKINEEADEKIQLANDMFADAEFRKIQADRLYQRVTEELHHKDITIASKERDLIIRAGHLDERTEALRVKELNLIDREQTLEREYARIKKI